MGIRKKITIGFLSLALLVVGAGAVSFFELSRIGKSTQHILDASNRSMTITHKMLDGTEMQHLSLLNSYAEREVGFDSLYVAGRNLFNEALEEGGKIGLAGIIEVNSAFKVYETETYRYLTTGEGYDSKWLRTAYWKAYANLTLSVKESMTKSELALGKQAENIESGAYRAITPSLITLGVILLLLLVLLYFIDIYYMKPVVNMNRGLADWAKFNTPFNVKVEGKDETQELKENIEELIDRVKRTARNPE